MGIRVLLADDHLLFAQAVAQLLAARYDVVEIVENGMALQEAALKHRPDIIIADITMPLMSGLESIRRLRRHSPNWKVIFLTMHSDAAIAQECFESGASAFVNKESSYDELPAAIERAMHNQLYISRNIPLQIEDLLGRADPASSEEHPLTMRQREILQLLAEGKTAKEIASLMNLSPRTVEWHKYRIMHLLRVRRSVELIHHAMRMKLVV